MTTALIDTFCRKLESLRGCAHVVADEAAAAERIVEITNDAAANCVALAGLSSSLTQNILTAGAAPHREFLQPPYANAELPMSIDRADIGVTAARFGISETGTVVEVTTDDAVRLVSSLPRTYIGVVYADTLVAELYDAADPVRRAIADHGPNVSISFISGPSRTGDIELILTLGVHGPEIAHAIVIESRGHGTGA